MAGSRSQSGAVSVRRPDAGCNTVPASPTRLKNMSFLPGQLPPPPRKTRGVCAELGAAPPAGQVGAGGPPGALGRVEAGGRGGRPAGWGGAATDLGTPGARRRFVPDHEEPAGAAVDVLA